MQIESLTRPNSGMSPQNVAWAFGPVLILSCCPSLDWRHCLYAPKINFGCREAGIHSSFTSCCAMRTFPACILFNCWAKHLVRILRTFNHRVDMRAGRIFLSLALAIGYGIPLQCTAFSQAYRGTWEQQRACTPDVWRLCGAQIPDVDRIVACLRRNTSQLSDRCRAVFAQGDAPSRGEDRGYGQRRYNRDYGPRPTTETTGQGPTTVHGLTTMTTNKKIPSRTYLTSMVYNRLMVEWLAGIRNPPI